MVLKLKDERLQQLLVKIDGAPDREKARRAHAQGQPGTRMEETAQLRVLCAMAVDIGHFERRTVPEAPRPATPHSSSHPSGP